LSSALASFSSAERSDLDDEPWWWWWWREDDDGDEAEEEWRCEWGLECECECEWCEWW
jgi:hypothetical protein